MKIAPIVRALTEYEGAEALVDARGSHSYADIAREMEAWDGRLDAAGVAPGSVVSVEADFSASGVAALLALAQRSAIIVPLSRDSAPNLDGFLQTAQVAWRLDPDRESVVATGLTGTPPLYATLHERGAPGLVLFTSGSTGNHKAAVHDLESLTEKFAVRKRRFRTLVFLQIDHIGGINTLFYTFSNGGTVIVPTERSPHAVFDTIAARRVELLPTSPTFLNLLLMAYDPRQHDLSSLKLVTYGTEPMQPSTLERLRLALPEVGLQQTYGLTEVGILRSQSRPDGSLWVKVGGDGFDVRVTDGRLWIKAQSAMLGYLNAPSPFSADGYLDTGDAVETDGEWIRILGRTGELINVGGSKVYPAEVENVLLQMRNVQDVVVAAEPHPLTGQIVVAHFNLIEPEALPDLKVRMRRFCAAHLAPFKIPTKVVATDRVLYGARFKKQRKVAAV